MFKKITSKLFLLAALVSFGYTSAENTDNNFLTLTVSNTDDTGAGSLRDAITQANNNPGADVIEFAIGTGAQTINVSTTILITDEVIIDGSSQPGFTAAPIITLAGQNVFSLSANASNSQISNLSFDSGTPNSGYAIRTTNISNVEISSNTLNDYFQAIQLAGTSNSLVQNNSMTGTFNRGIEGQNANNNTINNNSAPGALIQGFYFFGTNTGNTITNNDFSDAGSYAFYYSGTPTEVSGNDFSGSLRAVFMVNTSNFELSAPGSTGANLNTYGGHSDTVLQFYESNNITIDDWDFNSLMDGGADISTKLAINVRNLTSSTIERNVAVGFSEGIRFNNDASNTTVNDNIFIESNYGVRFLQTSSNYTVTNNDFTNSKVIGLQAAGNPTEISGNDFTGSKIGASLAQMSNFELSAPGSTGPNQNTWGDHIEHPFQFFESNNITIDDWDFTSLYANSVNRLQKIALNVRNLTNSTIENNIFTGFSEGIRFNNDASNTTVNNNNFAGSNYGVRILQTSSNYTITNNDFTNANLIGLQAAGNPIEISGNDFTGSKIGASLAQMSNFELSAPGSTGPNQNTWGDHIDHPFQYFESSNITIDDWDFPSLYDSNVNRLTKIALSVRNLTNSTVENNTITGFGEGIRFANDATNTVVNNNNASGGNYGIRVLQTVNGMSITNNNLTNNNVLGLGYSGTPTEISGNDFTGSKIGVQMAGTNNFELSAPGSAGPNQNTYGDHIDGPIQYYESNNITINDWDFNSLIANGVNRSVKIALFVRNLTSSTIENNTATGFAEGARLNNNMTNTVVNNNNFSNNNYGIRYLFNDSPGGTVTNNNLSNSAATALEYRGTPSDISGNDLSNSGTSLFLINANNYTLGANTYDNATGTGLFIDNSNNVTVENASFTGAGTTGIYVRSSSNITIDDVEICSKATGIFFQFNGTDNSVLNSKIASSSTAGIVIPNSLSNTTITNVQTANNSTDVSDNGTNTTQTNVNDIGQSTWCPGDSAADTTAPTITLTGDNPQTIELGDAYTELGATADDNTDGDISNNISIDATAVNTSVVGTYSVTYNVSDAAGNAATEVTRTVNVVDTTAPVVVPKDITLALDEFGTATITAQDVVTSATDASGSVTLSVNQTNFDCDDLGAQTVNITATDASGNAGSLPQQGLIGHWDFSSNNPLEDKTGNWGDIELVGGASIVNGTLDVDPNSFARTSNGTFAGNAPITNKTLISYVSIQDLNVGSGSAMTIDNVSGDNFDGIVYGELNPATWMNGSTFYRRNQTLNPGFTETVANQVVQMAITYEVANGEVTITVYRNGSVIGSFTDPDDTSWDPNNVEILFGARHTTPNQIGGIDAQISKAFLYDRALTAQEMAQFNDVSATATVTVVDNTAPTITLNGDASVLHEDSSPYTDAGATADDNCSVTLDTVNNVPQNPTVGTYTVVYTATDGSGNETVVTRTVVVKLPEPTAGEDTYDIIRNSSDNVLEVLANDDFGFNGPNPTHPLTFANGALSNASANGGPVSIGDNGTPNDLTDDVIIYTPPADFTGVDTITYVITDALGLAKTVTVTLNVGSAANVPYAVDDTVTFDQNSSNNDIAMLNNDTIGQDGITSITLSGATSLNGGTISVNENGTQDKSDDTVTYSPAVNFSGIDSFQYTVLGGNGNSSTATVTINVTPVVQVNGTPTAADDTATVVQDSSANIIDVLDNDTAGSDGYIDGGLTMTNGTLSSASSNGAAISIDNQGTADTSDDVFLYTPVAGFSGTDTFQYTITDASGDASTGTVNVTVTAITDVPTANDDTDTVAENSTNNVINMLDNDTFGSDGYAAVNPIIAVTPTVAGGSAIVVENGTNGDPTDNTIIYSPAAGFSGTDQITYILTDANGDQSTATITITVTPAVVNSGIPEATDDTASADQNGAAIDIMVLANDSFGPEGANTDHALTFNNGSTSSASDNGAIITVNDNNTPNTYDDDYIVYTPASGFSGTDTFTYVITDLSGDADTGTVTVTVGASSGGGLSTPTANDDAVTVTGNSGVNVIDVLANDLSGTDGYIDNGLTMVNGTLTSASTKGAAISIDNQGTADTSDDVFNYTPVAGFTGTDTFQYTITDASGDASTATVNVTVSEPNTITASDDTFNVDVDSTNNVLDIFGNDAGVRDSNGDPNVTITGLTIAGTASTGNVIALTNGTIQQIDGGVLSFNDDSFHYTPNSNYTGVETFTYVIAYGNGETTSAEVTINVVAVATTNGTPTANDDTASADQGGNMVPIDVLDNDDYGLDGPNSTHPITFTNGSMISYSDNGATIEVVNNQIEYTPTSTFSGEDTFRYRITDASGDASFATVTITVTTNGTVAVPTANDDTVSVDQDSTDNEIDVLANDESGIDGYIAGGLTMTNGTLNSASAEGGAISIDNKGTADTTDDVFVYTPPAGFSGTDTFDYTITDASGDASVGTVNITVTATSSNRGSNTETNMVFNNTFSVYPNPSNGTFTTNIESAENGSGTIVIYNVIGKVLYSRQVDLNQGNNTLQMNLKLSPGIVLMKVLSNTKDYGTKKIIIK
ncbi:MAG: hypothetical protein CMB99_08670 [Flavobacteriaceae bacterium]|nr:hypothetical protein [Flavobacteriaceae bacterium]|tara:strand:- start:1489 stop:9111 length:7623 start_codon:yes stop_codon:yes gene_type:complete